MFCLHDLQCLQRPEDGIRAFGAGSANISEPLLCRSWKPKQAPWKCSQCSPRLSCYSSLSVCVLSGRHHRSSHWLYLLQWNLSPSLSISFSILHNVVSFFFSCWDVHIPRVVFSHLILIYLLLIKQSVWRTFLLLQWKGINCWENFQKSYSIASSLLKK